MTSIPGTVNYPSSLDDVISLIEATNNAETTLDGALSSGALTALVADTTRFPSTGVITIVDFDGDGNEISREIVYYTGKTSNSFTGLIRGCDGTAAAAHSNGAGVEARIIARHHRVLADAIIATQTKLDAQSASLVASIMALDSAKANAATSLAGYGITNAFTKTEADARFAALVHNHDDRYFTETESDARFAAIIHPHALTDITGLISGGKIATGLLPSIAITDTSVVASQAAMLALTAETGDIAVRSDLKKTFILQGTDPTNLAHWVELQTPTDAVLSVNGQTGVVSLNAASVGALASGGTAVAATALATARNINGVAFDGTANITVAAAAGTLTGTALAATVVTSSLTTLGTIATGVWNATIITSAFGGTGNGFTKFSGPASSEKTFTLPNASATILTDNAAVTIAQGGTGQATAANAINALLPTQTGNNGKYLTTDGTSASWATVSASDATKLPLAGGTLTGTLTIDRSLGSGASLMTEWKNNGTSLATMTTDSSRTTSVMTIHRILGVGGQGFDLRYDTNGLQLGSTSPVRFGSDAFMNSPDAGFRRSAAGVIQFDTASAGTYAAIIAAEYRFGAPTSANGQYLAAKSLTELTTIAASAFTDTTIQIPAGAIVLAVTARVTAGITCTTNWSYGISGNTSLFGSALSKAATTTNGGAVAPYLNASALSVRITPDSVPSDATGRVRITIHYFFPTAPTS